MAEFVSDQQLLQRITLYTKTYVHALIHYSILLHRISCCLLITKQQTQPIISNRNKMLGALECKKNAIKYSKSNMKMSSDIKKNKS